MSSIAHMLLACFCRCEVLFALLADPDVALRVVHSAQPLMASVLLVLLALDPAVKDHATLRAHAQWLLALAPTVFLDHLVPVLEGLAALFAQDLRTHVLHRPHGLDQPLLAPEAGIPVTTVAAAQVRAFGDVFMADVARVIVRCAMPLQTVPLWTLRRLVALGLVHLGSTVREQASRPIPALAVREVSAKRPVGLIHLGRTVREWASCPVPALALQEVSAERFVLLLRLLLILSLRLRFAGRAAWLFAGLAPWVARIISLAKGLRLSLRRLSLSLSLRLLRGLLFPPLAFQRVCLLRAACLHACGRLVCGLLALTSVLTLRLHGTESLQELLYINPLDPDAEVRVLHLLLDCSNQMRLSGHLGVTVLSPCNAED
mmetsp:Transcript_58364/g.126224  ORF Transcript_58364/g.126224 Transcript_58364/m.126224 type:complete len:374 (+) Transcript_58364:295-1416(+)